MKFKYLTPNTIGVKIRQDSRGKSSCENLNSDISDKAQIYYSSNIDPGYRINVIAIFAIQFFDEIEVLCGNLPGGVLISGILFLFAACQKLSQRNVEGNFISPTQLQCFRSKVLRIQF